MGKHTGISWCDHTFNPWWGCARVSAGCQHCYAETFAKRTGNDVWGESSDRRFFGDKHWAEPLKWNAQAEAEGVRRRVFCASMADVFEDRPDLVEHRARLFALIEATPHLDWLLLTKRPHRAHAEFGHAGWMFGEWPDVSWLGPPNVWIGTTVEHQDAADERVPWLLSIPAPIRFLSCEPLLGPVDLMNVLLHRSDTVSVLLDALRGWAKGPDDVWPTSIDWVICGGESGPNRRPFVHDYARMLRDQCAGRLTDLYATFAGFADRMPTPFFFKQDSGYYPGTPGPDDLEAFKEFPNG